MASQTIRLRDATGRGGPAAPPGPWRRFVDALRPSASARTAGWRGEPVRATLRVHGRSLEPPADRPARLAIPVTAGLGRRGADRQLREAVRGQRGVEAVHVDEAAGTLHLSYDPRELSLAGLADALEPLGFLLDLSAAPPGSGPAGPAPRDSAARAVIRAVGRSLELRLALLGGVLLAAAAVVGLVGGPAWLLWALVASSAAATSTGTFPEAVGSLRERRLDIDTLMFAAAIGAAAIGHPLEGALLLFLFGLGTAGEHLALARARGAIDALGAMAPDHALRLEPDGETTRVVAAEELVVGDRVVVKPYERLPTDGAVESGRSDIDESSVTGEPTPADAGPGSAVFAGTLNGRGRLVVRVEKPASESTIARVVRLVEEAQAERSPTQTFTEAVERYYVPLVFGATAALIVVPPLAGGGAWDVWLYRAMAFLTAASPCALAIGTPAAVLCGVARAARLGVLIKGGAALETLGRAEVIAFDKTGTLTVGRPVVTDVIAVRDGDADAGDRLLSLAAAVEREVNHPIADAVARAAEARGVRPEPAAGVRQLTGRGAEGLAGGAAIAVTKPPADRAALGALADRAGELAASGRTPVVVWSDGEPIGLLAIADEPRPEAAAVVARLRELGARRVVMLTGDAEAPARAVGERVGVDDCRADLMPEEKLAIIDELAGAGGRRAAGRRRVAMVGDGVNDAPALARADIGVAVHAAGSDVALETAGACLMGARLDPLPRAYGLSRAARRVIRQNLVIALAVIVTVAPLAAIGVTPLGLAVLLHEGSTIVVVLNALRLLGWRG